MRYALQRERIDYNLRLEPDGTWSVQVGLILRNTSGEHLRYEIEQMEVIIENRKVDNPQFYNRGVAERGRLASARARVKRCMILS